MRHLAAKAEAARKLKEKKRLAALKKKKKKRGFGASMASTSSSPAPSATMSMTKKPSTVSTTPKGTPAKAESNAAGGMPQVTVDSAQQIVNIDFKTSAETSKDNLDDSGNEDEEGGDSPKFGG